MGHYCTAHLALGVNNHMPPKGKGHCEVEMFEGEDKCLAENCPHQAVYLTTRVDKEAP